MNNHVGTPRKEKPKNGVIQIKHVPGLNIVSEQNEIKII